MALLKLAKTATVEVALAVAQILAAIQTLANSRRTRFAILAMKAAVRHLVNSAVLIQSVVPRLDPVIHKKFVQAPMVPVRRIRQPKMELPAAQACNAPAGNVLPVTSNARHSWAHTHPTTIPMPATAKHAH